MSYFELNLMYKSEQVYAPISYGNESPLNEDQARLTKKWQVKMKMHI